MVVALALCCRVDNEDSSVCNCDKLARRVEQNNALLMSTLKLRVDELLGVTRKSVLSLADRLQAILYLLKISFRKPDRILLWFVGNSCDQFLGQRDESVEAMKVCILSLECSYLDRSDPCDLIEAVFQ